MSASQSAIEYRKEAKSDADAAVSDARSLPADKLHWMLLIVMMNAIVRALLAISVSIDDANRG